LPQPNGSAVHPHEPRREDLWVRDAATQRFVPGATACWAAPSLESYGTELREMCGRAHTIA